MFKGKDLTEASAIEYVSGKFEQNMYGHILTIVKNSFLDLPKEDVVEIINSIDNSSFFKDIIVKDSSKMNFYEKNLMYQYSQNVLKLKSIFTPEKIKEDVVIQKMWNGEIEETKILNNILSNITIDSFVNLLENDGKIPDKSFIELLDEHFKSVDLSDKNISLIMRSIIDEQLSSYEIARFIAKIDIPSNYDEFINSDYIEKYKWLTDINTFECLKESEKDIEDSKRPFLPAEYYVKKLGNLKNTPGVSEHFVGNLITLIYSDYYSKEEKDELMATLKENGLYSKYITDEKIEFDEKDTPEEMLLKVKKSYYSGQVIPLDIAKRIINDNLEHQLLIDKEVLQGCVQSIICNTLSDNDIDIQNKVFFGNSKSTYGYNDSSHKAIWINDSLLENYLNSDLLPQKVELFKTMFHEMQHAIQNHNIEIGNIDYLAYNFIKENVLEKYDDEFYSKNYKSIFMESDARKGEIIGALDFLSGLNPEFIKSIRKNMEISYILETQKHTIYSDSQKKFPIGKEKYIDISEYVGMIIHNNPQILEENTILGIEYNQDGTKKDIQTLLQEFEEQKSENGSSYKNIYSIYYGLITKQLEGITIEDSKFKEKIDEFFKEEQDLVTVEDMQNCYQAVDKSKLHILYSRLFEITRNRQKQSISEEAR